MSYMRTFMIIAYAVALLNSGIIPIGTALSIASVINAQEPQTTTDRQDVSPPHTPTSASTQATMGRVLTDPESDVMSQLRGYILATSEDTVLGGKAAMLLGLVATERNVPTKQISVALTDEIRYFTVSTVPDSDDIILAIKQDSAVRKMYLTNSKFLLRTAVVHESGAPYVIANEQAVAGFDALITFWIEKAKSLQAGQSGHVH